MGDLLMTTPALRALKDTFNCHICVLTSAMGNNITPYIPEIDEVIVQDLPWIKTRETSTSENLDSLVKTIKDGAFDAAVIFTVYSQSALPSAMLAFMADIPRRLAYCRENPYQLLTDWVPDLEPFEYIRHQVQRDLELVNSIGAVPGNDRLSLAVPEQAWSSAMAKLEPLNFSPHEQWIVFHPGVSEEKRKYPPDLWVQLGQLITSRLEIRILVTGGTEETELAKNIAEGIGEDAIPVAGLLTLPEFLCVIKHAPLVVSVNTATVHIAAAFQTPVIVLYALTNPQHTPWKVLSRVYPFPLDEKLQSKNVIIDYVNKHFFDKQIAFPAPESIFYAVVEMLQQELTEKQHDPTGIIIL